mgnify:FL=1
MTQVLSGGQGEQEAETPGEPSEEDIPERVPGAAAREGMGEDGTVGTDEDPASASASAAAPPASRNLRFSSKKAAWKIGTLKVSAGNSGSGISRFRGGGGAPTSYASGSSSSGRGGRPSGEGRSSGDGTFPKADGARGAAGYGANAGKGEEGRAAPGEGRGGTEKDGKGDTGVSAASGAPEASLTSGGGECAGATTRCGYYACGAARARRLADKAKSLAASVESSPDGKQGEVEALKGEVKDYNESVQEVDDYSPSGTSQKTGSAETKMTEASSMSGGSGKGGWGWNLESMGSLSSAGTLGWKKKKKSGPDGAAIGGKIRDASKDLDAAAQKWEAAAGSCE